MMLIGNLIWGLLQMTVFNWNLLYPLANNIINWADDDANIRTATNRYYILSYNSVRNYLIEDGRLNPKLTFNVHQKVLSLLKKSKKPIDLQLYNHLKQLKYARIIADYSDDKQDSKFLKTNINNQKLNAKKIMDILEDMAV